ncbi:MAG: hypothetical protein M1829_005895 [Trizodia sp. TS-e1964]|nr:MAG: hypothetical protein M1829_005895 [Trizodia sp. TS-e1964]
MEDRKRASPYDHGDSGQPLKRQATNVTQEGTKPHPDTDMPWKEEIERFKKEAIWLQMQEYKRDRNTLEDRLNEITERSKFHDDHLRVIDAWWKQMLQELKVLAQDSSSLNSDSNNALAPIFQTTLLYEDNIDFGSHLEFLSKDIKSTVKELFANLPNTTSAIEYADLQARLVKLLAAEKVHLVELDRVRCEKQQLEDCLERSESRYKKAEKNLDRLKLTTAQNINTPRSTDPGATNGSGKEESSEQSNSNGVHYGNGHIPSDSEARAVSDVQQAQIKSLELENKKLTSSLTSLIANNMKSTDDAYAKSDLFKHLKSQHEDVIKRVNHLEATNVQLREEAEKLQAERTSYRIQLEKEMRSAAAEYESQVTRAENDVSRIRTLRDELKVELDTLKASHNNELLASNHLKELSVAKDLRISALESEIQRTQLQLCSAEFSLTARPDLDDLSTEELKKRYQILDREYSMIKTELPIMVEALRKNQAIASKKIANIEAQDEKITRLLAEKARADQKYFAACKELDTRLGELRANRAQNAKSSEIITQLKEAEFSTQQLISNLEKQLTETRHSQALLGSENHALQQRLTECKLSIDELDKNVAELKGQLESKDKAIGSAAKAYRELEVQLAKLRAQTEELTKSLDIQTAMASGTKLSEPERRELNDLRVSNLDSSLPRHVWLTCIVDTCPLFSLPYSIQEHSNQELWTRLVYRMC